MTEDHLQTVLGDLTNERGGVVESVEDQQEVKRVSAIFPVASLSVSHMAIVIIVFIVHAYWYIHVISTF